MDIRDKEQLVQQVIDKMKEKAEENDLEELFFPEVEKCLFIELMKLDETTLRSKIQ